MAVTVMMQMLMMVVVAMVLVLLLVVELLLLPLLMVRNHKEITYMSFSACFLFSCSLYFFLIP